MKLLFLIMLIQSFAFSAEKTTAQTAPVKYCDTENIPACFQERDKANHAFRILATRNGLMVKKTQYVALLIHGLSDSPYFYRNISQILFEHGMNVVAIRTTGHGTEKQHLKNVSRYDWYRDVKYGMELAKRYGEDVVVAGMSLGGALGVREALINKDVKGLLLFSPAIKLPENFKYSCLLANKLTKFPMKLIGKMLDIDTNDYQARKEYGVDVRYQGIHNNGTCELVKVTREIEKMSFSLLNIPVFNVVSEFDTAIDKDYVIRFSSQVSSNQQSQSHLVLYRDPTTFYEWSLPEVVSYKYVDCMNHASVLLNPSPEMGYIGKKCDYTSPAEIEKFNTETKYDFTPEINFHFSFLENALNDFLNENF